MDVLTGVAPVWKKARSGCGYPGRVERSGSKLRERSWERNAGIAHSDLGNLGGRSDLLLGLDGPEPRAVRRPRRQGRGCRRESEYEGGVFSLGPSLFFFFFYKPGVGILGPSRPAMAGDSWT